LANPNVRLNFTHEKYGKITGKWENFVKIRDAPDTGTVFAGYPANPKAGYRISGKCRIPDIRPDIWLDNYIFGKISNKF
jgi:hypothetical protein